MIELLIVLGLLILLGSLLFWILIKAFRSISVTAGETRAITSLRLNIDWLIFDLKHVGFGISLNETSVVLAYCNGSGTINNDACKVAQSIKPAFGKLLLLKETTNIADTGCRGSDKDFGFGFAIWNGSAVVYNATNGCDVCSDDNIVCVWQTTDKHYLTTYKCCPNATEAPTKNLAVEFPIDTDSACDNSTGNPACCQNQNCTGIAWYLKSSSSVESCFQQTYIFYRKTTKSTGGFQRAIPVINCVADWDVWFYIDTDNDGIPDTWLNEIPDGSYVTTNSDLKSKLKLVKIYMLVQASYALDPNYDFCKIAAKDCDNSCGNGYILADVLKDADGTTHKVCLKHPDNPDWVHYRWKIVSVPVDNFPDIP